MKTHPRPLSPHLQVYKLHTKITSMLSITFRVCGAVLMTAGTIAFLAWILAAALGPDSFAPVQAFFGSWVGLGVLGGFTLVLSYHLANGLRHLFWDMGLGFEMPTLRATGILAVVGALVLTALIWGIGLALIA